jgi:hypothetical protein
VNTVTKLTFFDQLSKVDPSVRGERQSVGPAFIGLRRSDASKSRWYFGVMTDCPVAGGRGGLAMAGQGFFDGEEQLKALSAAGDPLEGCRGW